jgi:hypothetical protein
MDAAEYRLVITSQLLRILFATATAAGAVALSIFSTFPIGLLPSALIGLAFGYSAGSKFFPDSGSVLSRRFRNHHRIKHGKPSLDESEVPVVGYVDDFRRG